MNKRKKILIILSSIILILVITLIILLIFKKDNKILNKEQKELKTAVSNTLISSDDIKSYRAKVSIRKKGKDTFDKNYIVYNTDNSEYNITLHEGSDSKDIKTINIKKNDDKSNLDYNYTNTDIFLEGLEKGTNIKKEKKKLGYDDFMLYSFNVNKDVINNVLKAFDIETKSDGKGQVYIDKDNRVYLIIYNTDDININVSYTRIEEK